MSRLPVLNNSRIKAFRRCARLHYFAYVLALRPISKSLALFFGDVFHKALEAWWNVLKGANSFTVAKGCDDRDLASLCGKGVGVIPHGASIEVVSPSPDYGLELALEVIEHSELELFDKIRAEVMMTFYHERWIDAPWVPVSVERHFVAPLTNPATGARSRTWDLGGTLDVFVRHRDTGEHWVIEHKTSGEDLSPESDYWDRLRMDSQISTYLVGGREFLPPGGELVGCIYDVIGKPALRPKLATPEAERKYTKPKKCTPCKGLGGHDDPTAESGYVRCEVCNGAGKIASRLYANQREHDETPAEFRERLIEHVEEDPTRYLNRAEVVRLEDDELEAAADVWMTARNIREAERMGMHPRNPDGCHRYRRPCDYWQVCVGQADIDDPALFAPMSDPTQERTLTT